MLKKEGKRQKIKITRVFSGKPEDIWRLMYVQRRLMEIGQVATKKGKKR